MYIALSATKNRKTTVIVLSNEQSSLDAMSYMVNKGYTCVRFVTDANSFVRYSGGEDLEVGIDYFKREDGEYVLKRFIK